MAFTSPKMGLRIWNLLTDLYDHAQLADNWAKVDYHDHAPGRGVQIPTEGLADGAVTSAKLAAALDSSGAYETYRNIDTFGATLSGSSGGVHFFSHETLDAPGANGGGDGVIYLQPSDFAVAGRTAKLRIASTIVTNNVATGVSYTVSLYPVTAFGGSTTNHSFTLGTALAGSGVTHTVPPVNTASRQYGGDFGVPAAGGYVLGVLVSGAQAGGSVALRTSLQVHHV